VPAWGNPVAHLIPHGRPVDHQEHDGPATGLFIQGLASAHHFSGLPERAALDLEVEHLFATQNRQLHPAVDGTSQETPQPLDVEVVDQHSRHHFDAISRLKPGDLGTQPDRSLVHHQRAGDVVSAEDRADGTDTAGSPETAAGEHPAEHDSDGDLEGPTASPGARPGANGMPHLGSDANELTHLALPKK